MNNPNSETCNYLNNYINYNNPQFAVMLSGDWGSGKTYFIRNWIDTVRTNKKLKPLYISLYGMQSIDEVKDIINRLLHPVLTSKYIKGVAKVAAGLVKTAIKVDLGTEAKPVEVNFELDFLSLFQSESSEIKSTGKIIIFDDLERCLINRVQLLGFINYFVEHCGCKVIILCNEKKMLIEQHQQIISKHGNDWQCVPKGVMMIDAEYNDFKEKTIGATLEIYPNIEGALNHFLGELKYGPHDIVRDSITPLAQMLQSSECKNLRIVKQSLCDYVSILKQFPYEYREYKTFDKRAQQLLFDMVIVQLEMKSGNKLFALDNDVDGRNNFFISSETLQSTVNRYTKGINCSELNILSYESVKNVISFVRTHKFSFASFQRLLEEDKQKESQVNRLSHYWLLSNEDFEKTYKACAMLVRKHRVSSVNELIYIAELFYIFDNSKIKSLKPRFISDFEDCFSSFIDGQESLDDVYEFRSNIYRVLRYYYPGPQIERWKEIIDCVNRCIDAAQRQKSSKLVQILNELSDDNVKQLLLLIDGVNPADGSHYTFSPIFDNVEPQSLVSGIIKLSNQGKYEFKLALQHHYEALSATNYHENPFYEKEIDRVREIVELLRCTDLKSIDRYSVDEIIAVFQQLLDSKQ